MRHAITVDLVKTLTGLQQVQAASKENQGPVPAGFHASLAIGTAWYFCEIAVAAVLELARIADALE
ncbi:MAG: hypothetical protein KGL39_58365, partial [Patescibacteria group bacterium]|nr:hypothetical protein [Patescibacteria group bacterium]